MKPKTIIIAVLILLLLIIILQNSQVVTLRLLFWKLEMSRIILMPLLLLIGFGAGYGTAKLTGQKTPRS